MTQLAYIKGEEEKALWFYSQRLKYEIDSRERARLQDVIAELKKSLQEADLLPAYSPNNETTLTSISLSNSTLKFAI